MLPIFCNQWLQNYKLRKQLSVGITVCQRKQRTVVKFALRDVQKTIGVATDTLPAGRRPCYPAKEELVRRLDAVAAVRRAG